MASVKPTTATFGKFLIKILNAGGDPNNDGNYSQPCGLTSKGFSQKATMGETVVPFCDDPDAPADVERSVLSNTREITGSGVLAMEARQTWQSFYDNGASVTCRIWLNLPLANSGGYWQGNFVLETFNVKAERGKKIEVDITLQSDGEIIWNNASA